MKFSLLAVCILVFVSLLAAQSTDAVLSGNVLDPTGSNVPNATVTALNLKTGVATNTKSNSAGVYLFAALPPGDYRITAELGGFKKLVLNETTLRLGDRVSLNLTLEVGTTSDSVEVKADSETAISYVTTSVGGLINGQKILDLPVASRNAMDLVLTQAGLNGANFAGGRIGQLNISLDGINNQDNVINSGLGAPTIFPNVDRISEIQVVTSPADAEFGRGSGQVLLVSKSGTNQFHGTAYEFNRNAHLAANTWSNNRNGIPRAFLNRNQTGGSVGGPIKKNKTFFFVLFESQLIRQSTSVTATVPTDLARQGIFRYFPGVTNGNANANNPVVDLSGNPITPRNATGPLQSVNLFGRDPNRLAPDTTGGVKGALALLPSPNNFLAAGDGLNTAAFIWQRPTPDDLYSLAVRGDHNISEKHRLTLNYNRDKENNPNGFLGQPVPSAPGGAVTDVAHQASAALTSTLRSNLLNEFRAGLARYDVRFLAPWETAGLGVLPKTNGQPYILTFPSFTNPIAQTNDPQGRKSPVYQYSDSVSYLRGAHAFKAGVDVRFPSGNGFTSFTVLPRANLGQGNVAFTNVDATALAGIGSNLTLARNVLSSLAGSINSLSQTFNSPGGPNPYFLNGENVQRTFRQREVSFFAKDEFRVNRRLTLNLGVRWEYYGVPYEANGNLTGLVGGSQSIFGISGTTFDAMFRPGASGGSLTNLQLVGRNSPNSGTQIYHPDYNNFAPAVGLSWALPWFGEGKTIFRMGYGIGYERNGFVLLDDTAGFGQPGLSEADTFSYSNYVNLANAVLPQKPQGTPLATIPLTDRSQTIQVLDNGLRTPYVQNWNVSLGREMATGLFLDVRWVGSKGTRLIRGTNVDEVNIFENGILDAFKVTQAGGNAPLFDAIFKGVNAPGLGIVDGVKVHGSDAVRLNSVLQPFLLNNDVGGLANLINTNVGLTGVRGSFLTQAGLPQNFIVASPQFAAARLLSNYANSTYNSLQVEVKKRFSHGFVYQGSYVWSKTLGEEDGSSQSLVASYITSRNRSLDKRLLSYDNPHIFRNSGTYEFPFGPGRKFLGNGHGLISHLVEKWQTGFIFNKFAGTPLGLTVPAANGDTFNFLGAATPLGFGPIDKGFGSVTETGNNVVYFQGWTQTSDPSIGRLPANLQSLSGLFAIQDASGKLVAANPLLGTTGSFNPTFLRGPGSFALNVDLMKRVVVRERYELQVRVDAINLTNHPQWANPNTNIDSTSFGQITGTTAGTNRTIVLGARISF